VKINDTEKLLKKLHAAKPLDTGLQIFDAKFVATWQHIYFAVLNALKAFRNNENISKSLAVEIMIYASAQRQIQKAMKSLGITPRTSEMAIVLIGDKAESLKYTLSQISKIIKLHEDEAVLELTRAKVKLILERFNISDLELKTVMGENGLYAALTSLVIERMALLATQQ